MEKSAQDKNWLITGPGFEKFVSQHVKESDGRGVWWTDDISTELPIKMRASGYGSEKPITMTEMLYKTSHEFWDNNCFNV